MFSGEKNSGGEAFPTSFQSPAECLRRLPGLFVADVGVAHGRADILMAEQLLDFSQILSHVVKEDRRRRVPQPVGCDFPHPKRSASGPQAKVERAVGKRSPEEGLAFHMDRANRSGEWTLVTSIKGDEPNAHLYGPSLYRRSNSPYHC